MPATQFSANRLPKGVYNTYRQCKRDSQIVIKWVITTAAELPETASTQPKPTKTVKSKGGKKKNRHFSPRPTDRYLPEISLTRFLQLSRLITTSGIIVPKSILQLLSGVIKLRKRTAAFYSSDADAWKSNTSHRKAIEILMEAYNFLGGSEKDVQVMHELMSLSLEGDTTGLEEAVEQALLKPNTDGTIENEWIRDNSLVNPPGKKKKPAGPRNYKMSDYRFVEEEDENIPPGQKIQSKREAEVLFAVLCFFADVSRLREYCSQVWKKVEPVGSVSRITAACVTNQAVHITKQLEYDIYLDIPELRSSGDLYNIVRNSVEHKSLDMALYVEQFVMGQVQNHLEYFSDTIEPGICPIPKDGSFGYCDPRADRSMMTVQQKQDENTCVLMNYLPNLVALFIIIPDANKGGYEHVRPPHLFVGDDGLGPEFKKYYEGKDHPISMALIFSIQMVLNTFYIRREARVDDISHMRMVEQRIRRERKRFLTKSDITFPKNMSTFVQRMEDFTMVLQMSMSQNIQYRSEKKKDRGNEYVQMDALWAQNPWLCANAITYAVVDWWILGNELSSGAGFVQSTMHLWNILKQVGRLKGKAENPDLVMEHLIHVIGRQVFFGGPPTDRFGARYMLMVGQKAEHFAPYQRKRPKFYVNGKYRPDHHSVHKNGRGISPLESEVLCLHLSKHGLTKEQIERTKRKSIASVGSKAIACISDTGTEDWEDLLQPLTFIHDLVDSEIRRSTALITLNFYRIHLRCVHFFRRLWDLIIEDVCDLLGYTMKEMQRLRKDDRQLPVLLAWIISCMDESLAVDDGMRGDMILNKIGELVKETLCEDYVKDYILEV